MNQLFDNFVKDVKKQLMKLQCPECRRFYEDDINKEAIEECGMCLFCDHILTDYKEDYDTN